MMTLTDKDFKIVIINMILIFRGVKEDISIARREIEDIKINKRNL